MRFTSIIFLLSSCVYWTSCGVVPKDENQQGMTEAEGILADNVKKARTTPPQKPTTILLHGKLAEGTQVGFGLVNSDPIKIDIKQLEVSESGVTYELVTSTEASYDGSFSVEVEYSSSLLVESVLESEDGDVLSAVIAPVGSESVREEVEVVIDDVSNLATKMFLAAAADKTGSSLITSNQFDYFGMYEVAFLLQQSLENSIKDYGNIDIGDIDAITETILQLTMDFISENKSLVDKIIQNSGDGEGLPPNYFKNKSQALFLGSSQSWEDKINHVMNEKSYKQVTAQEPDKLEQQIDSKLSENGLDKVVAVWNPEEKKALIELKRKASDIETKKKILTSILANDELKDKLLDCDETQANCAALKELVSKLPKSEESVAEKKEILQETLSAPIKPEEKEEEFTSALKPKEPELKIPENKELTQTEETKSEKTEPIEVTEEKPEVEFEEELVEKRNGSSEEQASLALVEENPSTPEEPKESPSGNTEPEEQAERDNEDAEKANELDSNTDEEAPKPEQETEPEPPQNEPSAEPESEDLIAKNGCFISQEACIRHPKKVGVFADFHRGSDKNVDRCMRRALDFHRWCRNDVSDSTTAEFYQDGVLVEKETVSTACSIEQNVCVKHPNRVGVFLDYHQNSFKDEARCLRRANDFARWCGNSYEDATVARFYENGALISEQSTGESACEIELNHCSKRPNRAGKFLDFHRGSDTDQATCMNRAHQFARWCGNSYEQAVTARFFQQGDLVAEESTHDSACEVELTACSKHPNREGVFLDFHKGAHKDQDSCLKRATQYHKWCGNSYSQEVKVRFMQQGEPLAQVSTKTTGCEISQEVCRLRKGRTGTFMDYHQNAHKSEERCMKRAIDYHRWCGNQASEITTATYYVGDEVKSQTDTTSGCLIEQDVCLKHPNKIGTFLDNHKGSDKDQAKCLARAKQFQRWCGNGYSEITIAKFVKNNEVIAQKSTYDSACVIEQEVCRKHPKKAGLFTDYHQNADTDQARCLKRASDYHRWCGNTYDEVTTAFFYQSGEVAAKKDTRTACVIEQNTCTLHPHKVGNLIDWNRKTSSDPEQCMKRAGQIHRWCGNSFENVTVATYYEDGVAVMSKDTTSGCLIQQDQCAARPHRAGEFLDYHQNADTNELRCMKRAREYHRWCKNPYDTVTTAKFYVDGKLVREKDTKTSCVISQASCEKHSSWVGEFTDFHRGADASEEKCLKRSYEYHRWCGNPFESQTKASFYKDGNLVATKETNSGCFIDLVQCNRHPKRAGSFFDTHQNADSDQDRCLRRADDYHRWCKNPEGVATTASFYQNGRVEASKEAGK